MKVTERQALLSLSIEDMETFRTAAAKGEIDAAKAIEAIHCAARNASACLNLVPVPNLPRARYLYRFCAEMTRWIMEKGTK